MPNLHRLYRAGAATIVHAAATPYRERSHFDGQDVLESGLGKPGAVDTGWLNRALAALPAGRRVLAAASLRGRPDRAAGGARAGAGAVLDAAAPAAGERRHADAAARSLSPHRSGAGAGCWRSAWGSPRSRAPAAWTASSRARPGSCRCAPISPSRPATAAKFLARPNGPRIGALAFDGWDTHANEGAQQRPARQRCSARSTAPSRRSRPT